MTLREKILAAAFDRPSSGRKESLSGYPSGAGASRSAPRKPQERAEPQSGSGRRPDAQRPPEARSWLLAYPKRPGAQWHDTARVLHDALDGPGDEGGER